MLIELSLSELASLCHGELLGGDAPFASVVTDTRTISPGSLFIAIKGEHFDGHEFAQQALDQGASGVLSEQVLAVRPYVKVDSTIEAYGLIARKVREAFHGKIISITGSNGKTTVKDWLAQSFLKKNVLKTRANLNNQIGVPQTLLMLTNDHDVAVVEAGTSFPGEIPKLARYIFADIVILTNASGSHFDGFGNLKNIAIEKGALISGAKESAIIILNADDQFYDYWRSVAGHRYIESFGFSSKADLFAKDVDLKAESSYVVFSYKGEEASIEVGVPGRHQIANGMAVVLALISTGVSFGEAVKALRRPVQVAGRMERMTTKNNALLIDDCYNASPTSVEAAIDVLSMQSVETTWLVLGALGELGDQADQIHASLGRYAKEKDISYLVAVGPVAGVAAQAFEQAGGKAIICQSHDEAADIVQTLDETHAILVKGARSSHMEHVVDTIKN